MCANVLRRLIAMFSLALFFTSCAGVAAQQKSGGSAQISGVVKGAGGMPVVVHLRTLDETPLRYYDGYEEKTASDGSFHFADILPGRYRLETATSGFVSAGLDVAVRDGESRTGVVVSVTPNFSVCGRVTDNGVPAKTWVNLIRFNPEFGMLSGAQGIATEADGTFHITDVAPGMYYVKAYQTFYPGSFSFNGAKPIAVGAGSPAGCDLEIPMQPSSCQSAHVSGRIAGVPGDGAGPYRIAFMERNPAGGSLQTHMAMNFNDHYKAGDSFDTTVCPGDYDIVLSDDQINAWGEVFPSRKVVFDTEHAVVGSKPVTDIVLTPQTTVSIAGEVKFEGLTRHDSCNTGGQHVSILREGDGQFQTVDLDEKNHFNFRSAVPGSYTIYLGPFLREGVFVKSIVIDGVAVKGRAFTLAEARPATVVVTLSGDVTQAAGHISPDVRREPRWEAAWARPKGSVAGRIDGLSKDGYTVKLRSIRYNSNASTEYAVRAEADGGFRFDAVDPGVYTLRAESKDSLTMQYGSHEAGLRGTPIVVERGAQLKGLKIDAPKLSSVCGRAIDQTGSPIVGKRIFPQRNWYGQMTGNGASPAEVTTDADGRFRVNGLIPGEVFFASPLDGYRVVFFSSDGTLGAAKPIHIEAGKDVGCGAGSPLELHAPREYSATYTLAGKVEGEIPASAGDRFWIILADINKAGGMVYAGSAKVDKDRRFSFEQKVPGGTFQLELHSGYGPEPQVWSGPYEPATHLLASQPIDIHADAADVTIVPDRLSSVKGTVHFVHVPEEWKAFTVNQQRITLSPRTYAAPFSSALDADGNFSIGSEDAGDFTVDLNLRPPLYVRSMKLDGQEIKGRSFHLGPGVAAKLNVEVGDDSGTVTAQVLPDTSLPLPEAPMHESCANSAYPEYELLLFPDLQTSDRMVQSEVLRGTFYGDNPKIEIAGVPPGKYRALITQETNRQSVPFQPWNSDADGQGFASALAAAGTLVTVAPGKTLELPLPDQTIVAARLSAKLGVQMDSDPLVSQR